MISRVGTARLHRLLHRWRRPLAAVLIGLAVLLALGILRPSPPPTVPVVVSARDLPPGITLTTEDVRVVDVPAAIAPSGFARPDDVVGRLLALGIGAGELITASRFATGVGSGALDVGEVAVPVRLGDRSLAEFLQPGDVIDLVAAPNRQGELVAPSVRVITVPRQTSEGFLGGSAARADSLVLVAVPRRMATQVAASALAGPLAAVIRATGA
jgi:Flp pilus assembly protein CpaB